MIDFKKMDEKDFVFISKPLSNKDDKAFSEFLRKRKTKTLRVKKTKKSKETSNTTSTNRQHWAAIVADK